MNASAVIDPLQLVEERLAPALKQVRERLDAVDHQARTVIRARPAAVLLGALAVGYLVGRLVSR